jgi:hypothetical protein
MAPMLRRYLHRAKRPAASEELEGAFAMFHRPAVTVEAEVQ